MDTKAWWLSKTIQGQVVAVLGFLVELLKLPIGTDEVSGVVAAVLTIAGIGYSIYGRIATDGKKLTVK